MTTGEPDTNMHGNPNALITAICLVAHWQQQRARGPALELRCG